MRKYIQLACEEAVKIMQEDYGVDLSQFGKPRWEYWRDPVGSREVKKPEAGLVHGFIYWKHKKSGEEICLTEVFVNVEDGTIEQYGSNHGTLTL